MHKNYCVSSNFERLEFLKVNKDNWKRRIVLPVNALRELNFFEIHNK